MVPVGSQSAERTFKYSTVSVNLPEVATGTLLLSNAASGPWSLDSTSLSGDRDQ